MSALPKISIITASYNQGKFIEQTIQSIHSQGYPNLEHIILDACSTDETHSVLEKHKDKLKIIIEKDNGQSDAINKGLKMATGDIVAWLNSDDYYLPYTLQTVAQYFAKNPSCMWLTGDAVIINQDNKPIQGFVKWYKNIFKNWGTFGALQLTNFIAQPSTFWRKSVHDELGYLDEGLRYTMDYDFWLRIYSKYKLHIIPDILSAFRIHANSKGGSQFEKQFTEDYEVLLKTNPNPIVKAFHRLHNLAIVWVYKFIK